MRFPQRERVIGPESDTRSAEEFHEKPQGIGVVNKRIDVEARWLLRGREKAARRCLVINGAQIGTDVKGMFYPADREGERAPAMGESHAQFWEPSEDASEDHRTNRERRFGRHADQPGQPVLWHSFL